jgi:hypothetical protein
LSARVPHCCRRSICRLLSAKRSGRASLQLAQGYRSQKILRCSKRGCVGDGARGASMCVVKTGTCGWILIMAHTGKLMWFPSSFATTFPEFSYTHPGLPPPQRAGSSCSLISLDKYESSCTTASGIYSKTQSERARASVRGSKIVQT